MVLKGRVGGWFEVGRRVIFSAAISLIVVVANLGVGLGIGVEAHPMSMTSNITHWISLMPGICALWLPTSLVMLTDAAFLHTFLPLSLVLAGALYIVMILQQKFGYTPRVCFIYSFATLQTISIVYFLSPPGNYFLDPPETIGLFLWLLPSSVWGAAYFSKGYKSPHTLGGWCKRIFLGYSL